MTQDEKNARQREYRKANNNACTAKYERTKPGKLMRIYRNMKSRIEGVQKAKWHLYRGKCLLSKEDFYTWAMCGHDFHRLFRDWVESGYDRKLAPSVDRINPEEGYHWDNMQWVTHSENSRRGSIGRQRLREEQEGRSASQYTKAA